jgi:hypothetical protein
MIRPTVIGRARDCTTSIRGSGASVELVPDRMLVRPPAPWRAIGHRLDKVNSKQGLWAQKERSKC